MADRLHLSPTSALLMLLELRPPAQSQSSLGTLGMAPAETAAAASPFAAGPSSRGVPFDAFARQAETPLRSDLSIKTDAIRSRSLREPSCSSIDDSTDTGTPSTFRLGPPSCGSTLLSPFSEDLRIQGTPQKRRVSSWDDASASASAADDVTSRHSAGSPQELEGSSLSSRLCLEAANEEREGNPKAGPFPFQALPDELLLQCLARVSGSWAGPGCVLLRGVCQRWRRLVKSSAFLYLREALGRSQQWLVTLTCRTAGGLLCKLFDPLTNKCQRLPCSLESLPPERRFFGTACVGRQIFILGGEMAVSTVGAMESTNQLLDTVDAYDSVLDSCQSFPALPTGGRSRFACCSAEKRVVVIGGISSGGQPTASCLVLDTATRLWMETPPLPQPRVGARAEFCGGQVVVVGGWEDGSEGAVPVLSVDVLDLATKEWIPLPALPSPRTNMQPAVVHGRLCVVGGDGVQGANSDSEDEDNDGGNMLERRNVCFNYPLVFDRSCGCWRLWKAGGGGLRDVQGAESRLICQHTSCQSFQTRSYAVVAVYDELFLVRRCDKGRSSYCRHIHRFCLTGAFGRTASAWECIHRGSAYSSLLHEAGDCWEHSVVAVLCC